MSWNGPLNKIGDYRFEIPSTYRGQKNNIKMQTSALIYADEKMINHIRNDNSLEQAANVTTLPGIVGKSLAMPDIQFRDTLGQGIPANRQSLLHLAR